MWALFLYSHPDSKFYLLDKESKEKVIINDYLKIKDFKFQDYTSTLQKIEKYTLTPIQRVLSS